MTRLRFAADVMAATQAEDADNRDARRRYVNERAASMDAAGHDLRAFRRGP